MTALVLCFAYAVAASALFWAAFCRLTYTDRTTLLSVRIACISGAAVSVISVRALISGDWQPDLIHVMAVTAYAGHLAAGRQVWTWGVPNSLRTGLR